LSHSASKKQIAVDKTVCEARYPAGEAELYIHKNPGQASEEMASLTGQDYRTQPFAFLYREKYAPSCYGLLLKGANPPHLRPSELTVGAVFRVGPAANPLLGDTSLYRSVTRIPPTGPMRLIGPAYYYSAEPRIDFEKARPILDRLIVTEIFSEKDVDLSGQ
jgi:hypothetical protein